MTITTDIQLLRQAFEAQARDSHGFRRSRKGNYVNPQVARDWKWFQLGHKAAMTPAKPAGECPYTSCPSGPSCQHQPIQPHGTRCATCGLVIPF